MEYGSTKAVFVYTDLVPARDSRAGDLIQNKVEAELVYQTVESLLQSGLREDQIGIILLYRQQIKLISQHLRHQTGIEILTADRSQGRDKECIIISMVQSNDAGHVRTRVFRGDMATDKVLLVADGRPCERLEADERFLYAGALQVDHFWFAVYVKASSATG